MWGVMEQGSDSKAAGNRALKEWGASFERCDGGQGGGWGGGDGLVDKENPNPNHKSCGGLRTSTAADAGDVCSGGVKGWKGLHQACCGRGFDLR